MMGSKNHSFVQARLARFLDSLDKFNVFTELTIEINSNEYKPDVCLYPKFEIDYLEDNIKMTELPLLAIEILSPSQGFQELINKIKIYFTAGIKSAWLVMPFTKSIMVFSSFKNYEIFSKGNVIDGLLEIELSINEIFK